MYRAKRYFRFVEIMKTMYLSVKLFGEGESEREFIHCINENDVVHFYF